MPTLAEKLKAFKKTRQLAADTLALTLKEFLSGDKSVSEADFAKGWHRHLKANPDIFPEGWYMPPPHGIEVLFGTQEQVVRVSPKSARLKEFWASDDVYLDRSIGIAQAFASPVDRRTAMIGDFGLTLYFGNNKAMINHLKAVYNITLKIAHHIKIGMSLSEIFHYGHRLMAKYGVKSDLSSPTDPTGTNIGHTIPFLGEEMTKKEVEIFESSDWNKIKGTISQKRRFLNKSEKLVFTPGMGVTVEPRPASPGNLDIPTALFHTMVIFNKDGQKEILTGVEEIFRIAGMDYML